MTDSSAHIEAINECANEHPAHANTSVESSNEPVVLLKMLMKSVMVKIGRLKKKFKSGDEKS